MSGRALCGPNTPTDAGTGVGAGAGAGKESATYPPFHLSNALSSIYYPYLHSMYTK